MKIINLKTTNMATRFAQLGMAYSATRVAYLITAKVGRGGDFYNRQRMRSKIKNFTSNERTEYMYSYNRFAN